ncbi:Nucleoside diphosphate kinase [Candidatus Protochlamydia amoebophila]|nr:nucleoside-diphosphate kinase [Candidatus Protochlamydia amoebophila]MBS4164329.1 Nucleoside diphosphate kinase [Candidatus Protochlamydia amoebophila]
MNIYRLITLFIFTFALPDLSAETTNPQYTLAEDNQHKNQDDEDDEDWYDDDEDEDEDEDNQYQAHSPAPKEESQISAPKTSQVYPKVTETTQQTLTQQKPTFASEQTLSIIKPDAVQNNYIGEIISRFEQAGLKIAAIKMTTLTKDQASKFYAIHKDRPFYNDLVNFMSSGPVVVMVLEGNQAIAKNRELMGATDPKKAEKGTLRADFAESMSRNAVHGSDSPETAEEEVLFFFKSDEITHR